MKPAAPGVPGQPIPSLAEAAALERRLFGGDEAREAPAMERAGAALAAAVLRDFREIGGFPSAGRVLVLAGKGHNGGDALIATRRLLEQHPAARADVLFAFGERGIRPLAQHAWRELGHLARSRVSSVSAAGLAGGYDLCLDGIFGFQFRPPVPPEVAALFRRVEALPIGLRAAVDLPSGLDGSSPPGPAIFRADFTYATGSVKRPVVAEAAAPWVGRLRYLDLGFFAGETFPPGPRILTPEVLAPLARLRPSASDKRSYGHLFLVGGSHGFPGAILMSTLAALRSGVGLVTAAVPASLAAAFAARAPEAMWLALPETPAGGLALEGRRLLAAQLGRATVLAIGPGLGREPETLALARELVEGSPVPLVIDADALQPEIVDAGKAPRVLTPHAGEWKRIDPAPRRARAKAAWRAAVVVHKGPLTTVSAGPARCLSPFGGPVLARGGSGDLLTGLTGGLLAQHPSDPLLAACRAVVWHGRAAEALARAHGQVSVQVTQLLDYLPQALREG